jgi:hypothetical protein
MTDLHSCSSRDGMNVGHTTSEPERVDVDGSIIGSA